MKMFEKFIYLLGGGKLKFRVKENYVQIKGGGAGWFWFDAHFKPFETEKKAKIIAKMWADRDGGEFLNEK
jgi:hypothetical protein